MRIIKKFKSLIAISVVVIFLMAAGVVLKNIFLNQIKGKIQTSFDYTELRFSLFPPSLILEDARSISISPFFSAKRVSFKISYKSLLSKDKPINVLIESPILRIYSSSKKSETEDKAKFSLTLPFIIEKGLIKGGELYYWGKETRVQSKGINALFTQKKDRFVLQAEAEENVISLGSTRNKIEGRVSLLIEGQGKEIDIKSIRFSGPEGILKAEGSLIDPFDPELQLDSSFNIQTDLIIDLLNLPFEWEGKTEGKATLTRKNEELFVKASFLNKRLILNKVFMGKIEGNLDFNEKTGGNVEFYAKKRALPREYVQIRFKGDKIEGVVRGVHLDPIANFINIPWPVSSPAWGKFSIDKGGLKAEAEFKDEVLEAKDLKFPFQGLVKMDWDGKKKISFFSESLTSSFAHVELEGGMVVGQSIDVSIKGDVKDIKQAREFTSLVLRKDFKFPEIRGKGRSEVRIFGDFGYPRVQANFSLNPGGFDRFDFDSVEGEAEIFKRDFFGRFIIDDPSMKGRVDVFTIQKGIKTDIRLERGLVENILPAFNILIPLKGEASGNFEFNQEYEAVQLKGDFSGSEMKFLDQTLTQVNGKLDWTGDIFSFPELQFGLHEGSIKGSAHLQLLSHEFELDIMGEKINLSSIYPALEGDLSFNLKGKGAFNQDSALGNFEIKNLYLNPFQKTEARGGLKLGFTERNISLEIDGNFFPGENKFYVFLDVPLDGMPFLGDVRGFFTNIDLLLPWKGAKGRINYLAEIRSAKVSPQIKGAIDFQGSVFPFPQFAHAFRDYSGLVFFEDGNFSIRSLHGKLGGGDVQGSGRFKLGKGGVEEIDVNVEGKSLLLSPLERTMALADGNINLFKDADRFILDGDFFVHKLSWRREITEKFVFSLASSYESRREPGFFDDLTLNIRLKADNNAWMENSLGSIRGRFDLNITGNVKLPIVLGDIEAFGGDLYFQDREFKILRGRVSFIDPLSIEPYLSFKGETYVKDYRVTFSLDGLLDHLNPEFSSSPPLPPEDVLALLALGEAFKRTYSYDRSTQLSTASLLSFQLSEEAKKRSEGLFNIDRFRIDPFIMGSSSEMTARLTVGKKISRNFFILYSTNLTAQREEITRIEWELTGDLSIVGTRDEKGRISIDVKIHKRF